MTITYTYSPANLFGCGDIRGDVMSQFEQIIRDRVESVYTLSRFVIERDCTGGPAAVYVKSSWPITAAQAESWSRLEERIRARVEAAAEEALSALALWEPDPAGVVLV